jgi:hypothetical protein
MSAAAKNAISAENVAIFDKIPFILKKGFTTVSESGDVCRYLKPISHLHKIKALKHFRDNMLLIDEHLIHAVPGIYTWMLKGEHFYAMKLYTQQEIGSLHIMIDFLSKCLVGYNGEIVAAGELVVSERNDKSKEVLFNLQSGTFYERFSYNIVTVGKKTKKTEKSKKNMDDLVAVVLGKIRSLGIPHVSYIKEPFITNNAEVITNAERIALYNKFLEKEVLPKTDRGGKRQTRSIHSRRSIKNTKRSKTRRARK